jgi:hypothetical protein
VLGGEAAGSDSSASCQSKAPRCSGVCESERTVRGLARLLGRGVMVHCLRSWQQLIWGRSKERVKRGRHMIFAKSGATITSNQVRQTGYCS